MMPANEQLDVIIYRVRESGLEVFLVNHDENEAESGQLTTPSASDNNTGRFPAHSIELDPVTNAQGEARKAIAIEADWHEIPSLRALMYEDYRVAKEKARLHLKNLIPNFEKGTYVAVKEAFKRVLPEQYAYLKELKDIIAEKNQGKSI
jgi:hypothetical protein